MAKQKCKRGHVWDSKIYDSCPFCPSEEVRFNQDLILPTAYGPPPVEYKNRGKIHCKAGHLYDPLIYGDQCPFCLDETRRQFRPNNEPIFNGDRINACAYGPPPVDYRKDDERPPCVYGPPVTIFRGGGCSKVFFIIIITIISVTVYLFIK